MTTIESVDISMIKPPQRMEFYGKDLSVDPELQRRLDHQRANRMGAKFDPALLGVLAISLRADGLLYVVDGQHRHEAAKVAAYEGSFLCDVYEGLTRQQEAKLFLGLNDSRRPSPIDLFRLSVEAKDPMALHITEIAAKYGWKVGYQAQKQGWITAPAAMMDTYKLDDSGVVLDSVLKIITAAWGTENNASDSRIIKGLGVLLHRYNGTVDYAALTERLSRSPGPNSLVGKCRAMAQLRRCRIDQAMAEVLVDLYNQFRRNGQLPAWH